MVLRYLFYLSAQARSLSKQGHASFVSSATVIVLHCAGHRSRRLYTLGYLLGSYGLYRFYEGRDFVQVCPIMYL